MSDADLFAIQSFAFAVALTAWTLFLLARHLERARPGLSIMAPVSAAVVVRVLAMAVISWGGLGASVRGGDEQTFLDFANAQAHLPFGADWLDAFTHNLHVFVFAAQIKLLHATPGSIRMLQVLMAGVGIALIAAAVSDLGGARAGRLACWLLALEPAGAFFSGVIHKEALMFMASGLVILGATHVWRRLSGTGLALMAAGCLIGLATRDYAGGFLVAASLLIVIHASLLQMQRAQHRAVPLIGVAVVVGVVAAGPAVQASSQHELARLQHSQDYNAIDPQAHLRLARVDFSTRTKIVENLPIRVRDVLFKPYPWQAATASQQLGVLGTAAALAALLALSGYMWASRGQVLRRAGPFLYLAVALLVAYALASGNAGTSFRYRTHLIAIGIGALAVLRAYSRARSAAISDLAPPQGADPGTVPGAEPRERGRLDGPTPRVIGTATFS